MLRKLPKISEVIVSAIDTHQTVITVITCRMLRLSDKYV